MLGEEGEREEEVKRQSNRLVCVSVTVYIFTELYFIDNHILWSI